MKEYNYETKPYLKTITYGGITPRIDGTLINKTPYKSKIIYLI